MFLLQYILKILWNPTEDLKAILRCLVKSPPTSILRQIMAGIFPQHEDRELEELMPRYAY